MIAISKLALGLSAIGMAIAAPTEGLIGPKKQHVEQRGAPNFVLGPDHPLMLARRNLTMSRRSNTNYNQDYTTGGTVSFSPGTNQFSVNWNTNDDFVVGVGWNPGGTLPITHSGTFSVSSGLGSLSVYGWTTNPLVEYYVMECNDGISTGGSQKGTVSSDGGSYTIWENTRTNEPSIEGTSTFNQYISIRSSCTSSGTVTVENHFQAWAKAGLSMGTMNFQVIAVESWQGSGSASQSVTNTGTASPAPAPASPAPAPGSPAPAPSSPAPSSGGSCSAEWGQCGGIGWSGATCCQSGYTCKEYSAYYSQCLS